MTAVGEAEPRYSVAFMPIRMAGPVSERLALSALTGERIAVLESTGEMAREARDREAEAGRGGARGLDAGGGTEAGRNREGPAGPSKQPEARRVGRGRGAGMDLES